MNRGRGLLSRLAVAVIVPALILGATELLLRAASFGYPTSFYLRSTMGGRAVFVDNAKFGRRFFTPPELARKPVPFVLPVEKPAGAYRIILLGESAAMGDPDPSFGAARILERMLRAEYPGASFEVVNAGMVAINSHVIRHIARDCARLQPDAFIVYMGNNEVVGPYGPGTAFHSFSSSLALIRGGLFLRGTKIGQLVERLVSVAQRRAGPEARWNGMQMFLDYRVRADDPRLSAMVAHFERNLRDILAAAKGAGAATIVCTVGASLRAWPPFGSDGGAEQPYRAAQQAEAQGRYDEARTRYALARDLDTLRFRADSRINDVIRRAEPQDVLDAEQAMANASPHNLPGTELFLDHVHLNFHGNYILACAIADALASRLPGSIRKVRDPKSRPTEEQCAALLAFTEWDRFSTDESMYRRLLTPPFTFQLDHDQRAAGVAANLEARRAVTAPAGLQRARESYAFALAQSPNDWVLHQNLGNLLVAAGDIEGAVKEYRRVFEFIPQALEPFHRDAFALADLGRFDEALALIVTHNPDQPRDAADVYYELGMKLAEQGNAAGAAALLEKAIALNPANADAHYNLAIALAASGQWDGAMAHLRKVLELNPADEQASKALAAALDAQAKQRAP